MLEEIVIKPDTPFYAYPVCDITPDPDAASEILLSGADARWIGILWLQPGARRVRGGDVV